MVNSACPVRKSERSMEWVRSEYATYGVQDRKEGDMCGFRKEPLNDLEKKGSASSEELAETVSYLRVSS